MCARTISTAQLASVSALLLLTADAHAQDDAEPEFPIRPAPQFPPDAWGWRYHLGFALEPQASCIATFDLDKQGRPMNVCVNCIGRPRAEPFIREVERGVANWRYAPIGESDGPTSRKRISVSVPFVVEGDSWTTPHVEAAPCADD